MLKTNKQLEKNLRNNSCEWRIYIVTIQQKIKKQFIWISVIKNCKLLYSYPTLKNKKTIHLDENYIVIHIKN
jgi:hypothetical protein